MFSAAAALAVPALIFACTTFSIGRGDAVFFGKSYDWSMGQGLAVINKRGVAKRAFVLDPREKPAEWTSKHASLTFNQYGVELPNGGMNDAGLVVEIMWLAASVPERRDERPAVNELEWIQYQLDNFATVAEVVEHARDVRVAVAHGKVHYLVCDRSNTCAAFEHLRGELVVTAAGELPFRALTNSPYSEVLPFARKFAGLGGKQALPAGTGSRERFVRAAALAARASSSDSDTAFSILDEVRVPGRTQWNLVYDPIHLEAHFRTRDAQSIKKIALGRFDAACGAPRLVFDMNTDGSGDVSDRFTIYDEATNKALVARSFQDLAKQLPRGTIDRIAKHPESMKCAN